MQMAICHYSFHRRWKEEGWTPDRLAQEVEALGIAGADFHAGLLGCPDEAPELINNALSKHGLTIGSMSLSNDFNQEAAAAFREQTDTVKRWLQVAADVRAPVSRIFGGHMNRAEARRDPTVRERATHRILEGLGEVAREAEKLGVILAVENHGGLPGTGEEQVEIIGKINSAALKATIDVGNYMSSGQEAHEGTRIAAPHAAYVHFKDFKRIPGDGNPWGWKLEPCVVGEGDVDLVACLQALRDAGYDGVIALEYEGREDERTGVPKSVANVRAAMQGF